MMPSAGGQVWSGLVGVSWHLWVKTGSAAKLPGFGLEW